MTRWVRSYATTRWTIVSSSTLLLLQARLAVRGANTRNPYNKAPVPSNIYDLVASIYWRVIAIHGFTHEQKIRSTNWCRRRISVDVYLPTYLFQLISIGIRYHNYEIMQMRHFSDSRSRRCAHESMHARIRDNVGAASYHASKENKPNDRFSVRRPAGKTVQLNQTSGSHKNRKGP